MIMHPSIINQSVSLIATLRPESRIANDMQVEIIDKNSIRNKQCAYMYIGAGRDVWSGLEHSGAILMLVPIGQINPHRKFSEPSH